MRNPEGGPSIEATKEEISQLLNELGNRAQRSNDIEGLEKLAAGLRTALQKLPEPKSNLGEALTAEEEPLRELPDKSMEQLQSKTDRKTWVDMGSDIMAVPFPADNPTGYYVIPNPDSMNGARTGQIIKFYPDMDNMDLRNKYQFTHAAQMTLKCAQRARLGADRDCIDRISVVDFGAGWAKTGKVRKLR